MNISFGTEGWRAVIGETFTVENVRIVAQAIAEHVAASSRDRAPTRVAVGYDTRFMSDRFARIVCEVLAGNGIRAVLADKPIPTVAVSRYVVNKGFPAGIMVTASHNPAVYNGLKVKEAYGGSASSKTVESIERRIGRKKPRLVAWDKANRANMISQADFWPGYLQGLRSYVDIALIRKQPFRLVVDPMHGVAARTIEKLLRRGRCRVQTLHADPDPLFGGRAPEPIAPNIAELCKVVRSTRADLGIANDGDADRLGVIGIGGRWLNPGQVMCVLLEHLVRRRGLRGAVIKTVSNTMMIDRMAEALGLRVIEVPVGFKTIAKMMMEKKILIGGEESGGIGVQGYLPERDGILSALLLLEAIAVQRKPFSVIFQVLERHYGRWHYGRRDLHLRMTQVKRLFRRLRANPPDRIAGIKVARINRRDGVKLIGHDSSWLLFRRSGTEPIVRVYAESPAKRSMALLLKSGVRLARGL